MNNIKKKPEYVNSEQTGDFLILTTKQPLFSEPVYNTKIIRPNPSIINKEGYHIWDLASFDRKELEKVIKFSTQYLNAEILIFRQEKITNISFTKILPELTDNQKKAMQIAINSGYYDYPKKITLSELAKNMKIFLFYFSGTLKESRRKDISICSKRTIKVYTTIVAINIIKH